VKQLDDTLDAGTIARIVGGQLSGDPRSTVVRARADSRLCRSGDLYVALPGERTDGSLFVESAWSAGSTVALADQSRRVPRPPKGKALVEVSDPLASLQHLAKKRREQAAGAQSGRHYRKQRKNHHQRHTCGDSRRLEGRESSRHRRQLQFRNRIALTMMDLRSRHELAVLEMGMNRQGEMALLADIGKPRCRCDYEYRKRPCGYAGFQEGHR
jgi:UDP-N-acetylmuramoyl-tripeptide--D-alanyl-D-alanine ligase